MNLKRRIERLERLAPPIDDHEGIEAYRKRMEQHMECLRALIRGESHEEEPPEPTTPAEGGKYRQLLKDRFMRLRGCHES